MGEPRHPDLLAQRMPPSLPVIRKHSRGRLSKIVIGENKTFRGPEDYLRSRGVELVILNDSTCIQLMEAFIAAHPELWNEDIGE
jgi:hypothetical protein